MRKDSDTERAGMGLILWALASSGAGKTAILVYTMPFWILLFAWPILSEKILGLNWLPVIMAFTCCVVAQFNCRSNNGRFYNR